MVAVFPYAAHELTPAKCLIAKNRRNEQTILANIKSLSYLENIIARREAVKNECDEAILLNTKGHIAEASASNIFIVNAKNELITPHLEDGVLPGITRLLVLKLAKQQGITVLERAIEPDELSTAKEVFLTNSIIEIQPIKQIQDKHFVCDEKSIPITTQLQKAYKKLVTDSCKEYKTEKLPFFDTAKPKPIEHAQPLNQPKPL